MNADAVPAISTNSDLYVVSIAGGQSRKITITPGADSNPRYSPDGKYIAWRAQLRAGYESDRWRLMMLERSSGRVDQSDGEPGPLGQQLHVGAGFGQPVLHHDGPWAAGHPSDSAGGRRGADGGERR